MIDKILVIGPGSLVGSRFVELLSDKGIEIYGAGGELDKGQELKDFQSLDITDEVQVSSVVNSFPGKYVINFAGMTDVDGIEKAKPQDPDNQQELNENLAYKVNVLGTKYLVNVCKEAGKFPIFISTQFVFDGKNGPYDEDDPLSKREDVGWYGWTKILAEKEARDSVVENLVIRISYPYRQGYPHKSDFARTFLKLYDEVQSGVREGFYPIFTDQKLTPTFIDDLAPAVTTLIDKNTSGIFHVTSPVMTSPYEFCCELLKVARGVKNPEELVPRGSIVEFQQSHPEFAKRPIRGGERCDKIVKLGFTPTNWKTGINFFKG